MDTKEKEQDKVFALTKKDRCDRCGAGAQVALMFKSTNVLMFCGHHFSHHMDALVASGATVVGQFK